MRRLCAKMKPKGVREVRCKLNAEHTSSIRPLPAPPKPHKPIGGVTVTIGRHCLVVFGVLAALLAFVSSASAGTAGPQGPSLGDLVLARPMAAVTPIPPGPTTSLPDYVGAPAQAQPLPSSGVPQNPLLAPNGFNSCHLDPWMSDTANIPGALGVAPVVHSSAFAAARQPPSIPQTVHRGSSSASRPCSIATAGC